jgi:hypothetical protein
VPCGDGAVALNWPRSPPLRTPPLRPAGQARPGLLMPIAISFSGIYDSMFHIYGGWMGHASDS